MDFVLKIDLLLIRNFCNTPMRPISFVYVLHPSSLTNFNKTYTILLILFQGFCSISVKDVRRRLSVVSAVGLNEAERSTQSTIWHNKQLYCLHNKTIKTLFASLFVTRRYWAMRKVPYTMDGALRRITILIKCKSDFE